MYLVLWDFFLSAHAMISHLEIRHLGYRVSLEDIPGQCPLAHVDVRPDQRHSREISKEGWGRQTKARGMERGFESARPWWAAEFPKGKGAPEVVPQDQHSLVALPPYDTTGTQRSSKSVPGRGKRKEKRNWENRPDTLTSWFCQGQSFPLPQHPPSQVGASNLFLKYFWVSISLK